MTCANGHKATRCAKGHYTRTVWTGFDRPPLELCAACDRVTRTTNQLWRERAERQGLYRRVPFKWAAE